VTERTVGELGEARLIARIRDRVPPCGSSVVLGVGDDAAVIAPEPRRLSVVTTDALVEGVHFEWRLTTARDVGAKALAVNLSDLAAMGAAPLAAVLSLGLPESLEIERFDAVVEGLIDVARRYGVAVVGGNITRSPGPMFIDVTAFGSVHPRRVLRRSGARPGDELYVSGTVGGAAAGLRWLLGADAARVRAGEQEADGSNAVMDAVARYRQPEPRVRLGMLVGRNRAASACVDLSDGLADAIRQLTAASQVGARIEGGAIPVHPSVAEVEPDVERRLDLVLSGGEDYELLFAVPRRRRRTFLALSRLASLPPVTRIGELTASPDLVVRRQGHEAALPRGFAHFDPVG